MFFFVSIFRNLLWDSVNYGQSLHRLHNTKGLRPPGLDHHGLSPIQCDTVMLFVYTNQLLCHCFSFALMFANGWFASCHDFYVASACWLSHMKQQTIDHCIGFHESPLFVSYISIKRSQYSRILYFPNSEYFRNLRISFMIVVVHFNDEFTKQDIFQKNYHPLVEQ